jgi:hypothetical protein
VEFHEGWWLLIVLVGVEGMGEIGREYRQGVRGLAHNLSLAGQEVDGERCLAAYAPSSNVFER